MMANDITAAYTEQPPDFYHIYLTGFHVCCLIQPLGRLLQHVSHDGAGKPLKMTR